MTIEQYMAWLEGYLAGVGTELNDEQREIIKDKMMSVKTPQLPVQLPLPIPTTAQPYRTPNTLPWATYGQGWICGCGAHVGNMQVHNCQWSGTITYTTVTGGTGT